MNQLGGFPLLTLILFLPTAGAAISLAVPRSRPELLRWLALLITATDLFVALFLYMAWVIDPAGGFQFVDGPWPWIADLGLAYHLAIDGLNLHFVPLTALLMVLVQIASWLQGGEASRWVVFWTFLLQAGLIGALMAANLALLAGFWTLAVLAAALLGGHQSDRPRAARWMIAAGVLVGAALLILTGGAVAAGVELDLTAAATLSPSAAYGLFWPALLAGAITGAAAPLHAWYPPAQRAVPSTTRVLLAGLLLNLGAYGLIRLCLGPLLPAAVALAVPMRVLGLLGLWYGALIATRQREVPATLAYWNVSRAGLTLVGVFTLSHLALHGAVLHLLSSSLSAAAVLLIWRPAQPRATPYRVALGLSLFSAAGLPGLFGFVGTGTILLGMMIPAGPLSGTGRGLTTWAGYLAAGLGVLFAAWALIRSWRAAPGQPPAGQPSQQVWAALPLLVLIVLLGVAPSLVAAPVEPTVHRLLIPALDLLN